jgi:hypothetical protein
MGNPVGRVTFDPCPECGARVKAYSAETITVVHNPEAVLNIGGTPVINPAPNPLLDVRVPVDIVLTLEPCGHQLHRHELERWHVHQEVPSEQG